MDEIRRCPYCGRNVRVRYNFQVDRTGLYIMVFIILLNTCLVAFK